MPARKPAAPPPPPQVRRPARVAQALARAHHLQAAIDRGEYADRTDAAQIGFTRGRLTKLLDLTLLAPDIQEEILHLEAIDGREPVAERDLHYLVRHKSRKEQRQQWDAGLT